MTCTTCTRAPTLPRVVGARPRSTERETAPGVPRVLQPPCADRSGALPEGCPGWCEYSRPEPRLLFFGGDAVPDPVPIGTTLPGGIHVTHRLGEGGMGVVYGGWHEGLERAVAIKFLAPRWVASPVVRGRFLTEARALARLRSPHVVRMRELGLLDGVPYLVMDHVGGRSLSERIHEGVPMLEALRILESIARGLAAVHQSGALHNDIKPSNVIVGEDGPVTLIDFGLARPFASVCRLEAAEVSGTPTYMAPELASGEVEAPGPATDLYSFGVLAFEVITGRVPFEDETSEDLMARHQHEEAPLVSSLTPGVPPGLDALVAWCLRKEPYHRIPSASVLAHGLSELRAAMGERRPDPAHR